MKKRIISVLCCLSLFGCMFQNYALLPTAQDTEPPAGWASPDDQNSVTGNPTDGWTIDYNAPYDRDTQETPDNGDQQVTYDAPQLLQDMRIAFSIEPEGLQNGDVFYLNIANSAFTPRWGKAENGQLTYIFEYMSGTTLKVYTTATWQTALTISDFDFSASHLISFRQNGEQWNMVLDGQVYSPDIASCVGIIDAEASEEGTEPKTVLGFSGEYAMTMQVNVYDKTSPEGWTSVIDQNLVTGNPTDGWMIDYNGGAPSKDNQALYAAPVSAREMIIEFSIDELAAGKSMALTIANAAFTPRWGNAVSPAGLTFIFERMTDGTLRVAGFVGNLTQKTEYKDFADFDFSAGHLMYFSQVGDEWHFVLDGKVFSGDFTAELEAIDAAEPVSETVLGFSGESAPVTMHVNVHKQEQSAWTALNGAVVTGNSTDGWTVRGNRAWYAGSAVYNTPGRITENAYQLKAALAAGESIYFAFANNADMRDQKHQIQQDEAVREENGLIELTMENKNGTMIISYIGTESILPVYQKEGFDFAVPHSYTIGQYLEGGAVQYRLFVDGETTAFNQEFSDWVKKLAGEDLYWYVGQRDGGEGPMKEITGLSVSESLWQTWNGAAVSAGENGADLSLGQWGTVTYKRPIDPETQAVSAVAVPSEEGTHGTVELTFSTSHAANAGATLASGQGLENAGGHVVTIDLERFEDGRFVASLRYDAGEGTTTDRLCEISDFDFDAAHTFGLTKVNGKWYFSLDNRLYEGEKQDMTPYVEALVGEGNAVYPYIGAFNKASFSDFRIVSRAETLPDWAAHDTSVSGNAADGYTLTPNEYGTATLLEPLDLSEEYIQMIITEAEDNKAVIALGSRPPQGGTSFKAPGKVNNSLTFFMIKEKDTGRLRLSLFNANGGESVVGYTEEFDWAAPHTLGFVKDGESWYVSLDGMVFFQTTDDVTPLITEQLNAMEEGGAYLQLGAVNAPVTTYSAVKIVNEPKPAINEDWAYTSNIQIGGDADDGYSVTGQNLQYAYYRDPLNPFATELHFKMNSPDENTWNYISISADPDMGILPNQADIQAAKGMILIFERKGTRVDIRLFADPASMPLLGSFENFDFSAEHTLSFVNQYGTWYLVFDGQVLRQTNLNSFMDIIYESPQVYYRFTGYYNGFGFSDLRFVPIEERKPDDSDWEVDKYLVTETADGLEFSGSGVAAYLPAIDPTNTSFRWKFNPELGDWCGFQISSVPGASQTNMSLTTTPEEYDDTLSFIMAREENSLRLSLFGTTSDGGRGEVLIGRMENFDFDAVHLFRFVQMNGKWCLFLDRQLFEFPSGDGENDYVTNAITGALNRLGNEAYIRLFDCFNKGVVWSNISFTEEAFELPIWEVTPDMTVTETEDGWTLQGTGDAGYRKPFNFDTDKLQFQVRPAKGEYAEWVAISFSDTASVSASRLLGIGNEHNAITILLSQNNEEGTEARLSLYHNGNEIAFAYLKRFNFDEPHTLSFTERKGNWSLNIDGAAIETPVGDGDDALVANWITTAVNNLRKGSAYVRVALPYETTMSHFRIIGPGHVDNSDTDAAVPRMLVWAVLLAGAGAGIVWIVRPRRRQRSR